MEKTPIAHLSTPLRFDKKQTGGVIVKKAAGKSPFDVPAYPRAETVNVARVEILERENFLLKRQLSKLEKEFREFREQTIENFKTCSENAAYSVKSHNDLVDSIDKRFNDDAEMIRECYAKLFPEAVQMQKEIFDIMARAAKRKRK